MTKRAFASAIFALLATLLLAFVGMNVMLSSSAGSHSNDLLQAQLVHDRQYDAANIWRRALDDATIDAAFARFSCSSFKDPSVYDAALAGLCNDINGGSKIIGYETKAFNKTQNAGDAVSFDWGFVSIDCANLSTPPAGLYPANLSTVLEIRQKILFRIETPSAGVYRTDEVRELLSVWQEAGTPPNPVKKVHIVLHNDPAFEYSAVPPVELTVDCT